MNRINRISEPIWNSGVACIAIASAVFSIAASLVRLLDPAIPILQIVAIRSIFSLCLSVVAARSQDISPLYGQRSNMPVLAMRGLTGAAAMDCFYIAIQRLPLAEALALMFLNPAVTALLAWPILKEPLAALGIAGCIISLLGMLLVVQPPALFGSGDVEHSAAWNGARAVGVAGGAGSAVLAAGAYLTIRTIGDKERPLTMAFWFHATAVGHSSILLLFGFPQPAAWPSLLDWVCLVGIAASSFTANILLTRGFQLENAALASGINYMQVVYGHALGWAFYGEEPSLLGLIGTLLIAVGIVAVAMGNKKKVVGKSGNGSNSSSAILPEVELVYAVDDEHEDDDEEKNAEERGLLERKKEWEREVEKV